MPATCWSSVRGRRLRATRVDECCAPVAGTCAQVVTDGFISIEYSPEIAEGEEIEVRKADGTLCISDKPCDELKWINVEAQFCQVDPDLFTLLTGYPTVVDFAGVSVGNQITGEINCSGGVSLEVWSDVPGVACTTPGATPFGYFLLPCLVSGIIGDYTIENDAATFTITGRSKAPNSWGDGPYNVVATDAANTAGPLLTPLGTNVHQHIQLTTIAPPPAVCGCQPLVIAP